MPGGIRNVVIEQGFSALDDRSASLGEQMIGANERLYRIERRMDLADTPV